MDSADDSIEEVHRVLNSLISQACLYLHYDFPYFLPERFFKGDGLDAYDRDGVGLVS